MLGDSKASPQNRKKTRRVRKKAVLLSKTEEDLRPTGPWPRSRGERSDSHVPLSKSARFLRRLQQPGGVVRRMVHVVVLMPISTPWGRCGEMESEVVGQFTRVRSEPS